MPRRQDSTWRSWARQRAHIPKGILSTHPASLSDKDLRTVYTKTQYAKLRRSGFTREEAWRTSHSYTVTPKQIAAMSRERRDNILEWAMRKSGATSEGRLRRAYRRMLKQARKSNYTRDDWAAFSDWYSRADHVSTPYPFARTTAKPSPRTSDEIEYMMATGTMAQRQMLYEEARATRALSRRERQQIIDAAEYYGVKVKPLPPLRKRKKSPPKPSIETLRRRTRRSLIEAARRTVAYYDSMSPQERKKALHARAQRIRRHVERERQQGLYEATAALYREPDVRKTVRRRPHRRRKVRPHARN